MRALITSLLAVLLGVGLVACAPQSTIEVGDDTVVVDVRTPEEYASGHLEGAVNLDVQDPGFLAEVSELDPEADYVVYCRSGNRSAVAVSEMRDAGLDQVTDAGALQSAAGSTGLPIVTE